mgnify:CR=1 FL=1
MSFLNSVKSSQGILILCTLPFILAAAFSSYQAYYYTNLRADVKEDFSKEEGDKIGQALWDFYMFQI